MSQHNQQERDNASNKVQTWIWFLIALLINFGVIVLAGWLAFNNDPADSILTSMLAGRGADYGISDNNVRFAPLSQDVLDEIARDSASLRVTPNSTVGDPDDIVQFPPTIMPVSTQTPTRQPTVVSGTETAVSPTPTDQSTTPSNSTSTPTPTQSSTNPTATNTPATSTNPTNTPAPLPTNTPLPPSTNTPVPPPPPINTPLPPPTNTPVPPPTNTPVPPPTNTPVPPPTNTPVPPPTNTPVPPPTPTPGFGVTPLPTTEP